MDNTPWMGKGSKHRGLNQKESFNNWVESSYWKKLEERKLKQKEMTNPKQEEIELSTYVEDIENMI